MPTPDVDVAVIGAGPAGIAAALGLLAEGLRVAVIDPGRPPAARVESLPANGIELAEGLGLTVPLQRASLGRASAMRMLWRAAPETRDFGRDGPLLLDKQRFHACLQEVLPHEVRVAGRVQRIETREDHLLVQLKTGSFHARLVIDARGRSALRGPAPKSGTMALAFHARIEGATRQPVMLLEALEAGWLWASLLPEGQLSGALFLPVSALAGKSAAEREALLRCNLARSALGLPPMLAAAGVAPAMLRAAEDPFATTRHLRIGDAALARDPIASHGLVHAMRSGAQAAAAAATILDPEGQPDAACAFIRDRHAETLAKAITGTSRSHADQARFDTGFWAGRAVAPPVEAHPFPALSRPLSLAPLCRAAELQGARIGWTKAVWLPRSNMAATRFGPVSAARLAELCADPAPLTILSARLERTIQPSLAVAILRHLLEEGALTERPSDHAPTGAESSA